MPVSARQEIDFQLPSCHNDAFPLQCTIASSTELQGDGVVLQACDEVHDDHTPNPPGRLTGC